MSEELKLQQLNPGDVGRVTRITASGLARRRLLDLGIIPGTLIEALFTSPSGDPIAYRIRGAVIALRKEESTLIYIQKNN